VLNPARRLKSVASPKQTPVVAQVPTGVTPPKPGTTAARKRFSTAHTVAAQAVHTISKTFPINQNCSPSDRHGQPEKNVLPLPQLGLPPLRPSPSRQPHHLQRHPQRRSQRPQLPPSAPLHPIPRPRSSNRLIFLPCSPSCQHRLPTHHQNQRSLVHHRPPLRPVRPLRRFSLPIHRSRHQRLYQPLFL